MENYIVTTSQGRCVSPQEGCEILREIHEGGCGHHTGSKSLVAKAFFHGFYWLTAHADAEDLVVEPLLRVSLKGLKRTQGRKRVYTSLAPSMKVKAYV